MIKKLFIILLVLNLVFINEAFAVAQSSTVKHHGASWLEQSSETESTTDKLEKFLTSMRKLLDGLKKRRDKESKSAYRKIKLINKRIIKSLNLTPPEKCLDLLDTAVNDFYSLVSDLSVFISCGPNIIPPFLPGTEEDDELVTPDCIPPEEFGTDQFSGVFSETFPVYEEALDVFRVDADSSNLPDVCE